MRTKLYLLTIGIAIAIVAAGCNKSSSTAPQSSTAPTFPTVTIKGPNTNSTDSNPQMIKSYATSVSGLATSSYVGLLAAYKPTQNGNTWTWTVQEGTLTGTFTATKQADGSITWSAKQNGTDAQTQVTYNNWVALTGTTSADGKSGELKTYFDNTTTVEADFVWTTNESNVLTATLTSYNNSGTATGKIVIINNPDNSGEFDTYTGAVMTYKATWITNGSGTWWTYDSTRTQTGTGTWS